jgi:hypothetical protein
MSSLQSDFKVAKADGKKEDAHAGEDEGLFPDGAKTEAFQHDAFHDDEIPTGWDEI